MVKLQSAAQITLYIITIHEYLKLKEPNLISDTLSVLLEVQFVPNSSVLTVYYQSNESKNVPLLMQHVICKVTSN